MKTNQKKDIVRRGIISLVILIVVSFIVYTSLLISTTVSITKTRNNEKIAQNLRSEIADLEATYLTSAQKFSLEYAISSGYQVVETPYFAKIDSNQNLTLLSFKHD